MEATTNDQQKSGEDRISELSDDVLCHILSFLSIKEVITTSLLSTRWRFLWTMVPSLDIQCSKPIMKFYERVNTFLDLRRTEKITRFHFTCSTHRCCSRFMEEWVSEVVARKVEQVNISLSTCHTSLLNFTPLFNCTTIVTLKIEGRFDLFIPSFVHLPNVKTLHLHMNTCIFGTNIGKFIRRSSALELFHLKQRRYPWNVKELKIVRNSRVIQLSQHNWLYRLAIQSDPDYDFISYYLNNCSNIVKAKVYMTMYSSNNHFYTNQIVATILQSLCHVKFLSLGDFRAEIDLSSLNLPHFKNLVELRLFLRQVDSLFMELPTKCPKLEVLEVNIMDDRYDINHKCRYHVSGGVWEPDLSIVPV